MKACSEKQFVLDLKHWLSVNVLCELTFERNTVLGHVFSVD